MIGIYTIKNEINNKIYIGKSNNIQNRWKQHISDLEQNKHRNARLQKDWNVYGITKFNFSVEEICEKEDINDLELLYINKYFNNGDIYNSQINTKSEIKEFEYIYYKNNRKILIPNDFYLRGTNRLSDRLIIYAIQLCYRNKSQNIKIKITDLFKEFDIKPQSFYRDIDKYIDIDLTKIIVKGIKMFNYINYNNGIINVEFTNESYSLLKYKNNYNTFNIILADIVNFKSSNTLKILIEIINNKNKFTIEEFKNILNLKSKSYNNYSNLKLKIINMIINDLKNIGQYVILKEHKLIRSVIEIEFINK